MRRTHASAAVLALASGSALCLAQNQPADTVRPIMWMHASNGTTIPDPELIDWPQSLRSTFPPRLRVYLDRDNNSPALAAQRLAEAMRHAVQNLTPHSGAGNRLALFIQNFAHNDTAGGGGTRRGPLTCLAARCCNAHSVTP